MSGLDDAKFQEAILNGDWEALDSMVDAHAEDEEHDLDENKAKKDEPKEQPESAPEEKVKEDEGDKPTDTDVVSEDDKTKDEPTDGDTSTPADIAEGIEGKISFDDDGNAIVPKELLTIIAKNGKHEIPYGVLESTRTKTKEATTALEQERLLRQEAEGKLTKNDRKAELLTKQLADAGIDPEQLPEDIEITPELIESLGEYGDLGKVLKAVIAKQGNAKEEKQGADTDSQIASDATPDPRYDDYKAYVAKNPEFQAIMDKEGSDEQATLEHFYTQVTKSSAFKDKPLAEQLDEVMVRTNRSFGKEQPAAKTDDETLAIAQQKVQEAKDTATPASPSEVGNVESGKGNALERARAATGAELLKIMEELTPTELETLIDEMDD